MIATIDIRKTEIVNFRNRIERLINRSPSLKNHLEKIYPQVFEGSVRAQRNSFDIPDDSFVELNKILDSEFFG